MAFKAALRVRDAQDLRAKLAALAAGTAADGIDVGCSQPQRAPLTYWVLDGSCPFDTREMEALAASCPLLQEALDDCARHSGSNAAEDPAVGPRSRADGLASFAQQYALGRLLLACKIEPAAIVAEGTGVLAAACLLGMVSLRDATTLLTRLARHPQGDPAAVEMQDGAGNGMRRCPLVIAGDVLRAGENREVASRLASAAAPRRRLASDDVASLERGDHLFVHLGGQADLRARLGATDMPRWLALPPDADANARLLALFGRLYVCGMHFDALPLAAPGARRVPLPTYPFENRAYRCKPLALLADAAAADAADPDADADAAPRPEPLASPCAAPLSPAPERAAFAAAPTVARPTAPLRPFVDGGLTSAQRQAAHDALRDELGHLF